MILCMCADGVMETIQGYAVVYLNQLTRKGVEIIKESENERNTF